MSASNAELVADLAHRYLRADLTESERRTGITLLAEACPVLRFWNRWVRSFSVLFPLGVTSQYGGLLTIALDGSVLLAAGLLIIGMVTVAALTVQLHRAAADALDIAVGLTIREPTLTYAQIPGYER